MKPHLAVFFAAGLMILALVVYPNAASTAQQKKPPGPSVTPVQT